MFQLKFNENFDNIIQDITHWKSEKDIPNHIKKFIIDTSNMRVIYEKSTNKFYCGKCTEELDKKNYCKKCNIHHKKYTLDDVNSDNRDINIIDKKMSSKISDLDNTCKYLVFDIVGENVIIYCIVEKITYNNPISLLPYKSSKIYVDTSNSYYVEKDGVTNLETNNFTSFSLIDNYNEKLKTDNPDFWESEESSEIIDKSMELEADFGMFYLYTDNLSDLKNTIYKYSKIWKLKDYLKEKDSFPISTYTINPLYYPSYEYLVNYKLYNLACTVPDWFKKGKNFKEIFGIDKKYLPFMSKNNITCEELKILRYYPTTDIEILRLFSKYCWDIVNLDNINIDLKKLKNCLDNNNLSIENMREYLDYINMAKELNLDLTDRDVLYPKNLIKEHDELYMQIEVVKDPVIDKKIRNLANILSINKYEDDEYIIYPASSIKELVDESRQQKNCVRMYCERISNNESQIYFMRKKNEPKKSLVTIEVKDKRIIQARVKYNELPSKEQNNILKKWEKNLIPITND